MDVIISIDTEEDNQWDFSLNSITTENLKYIPRFQELCNKYGFKPTYLCTTPIVESKDFNILIGYQNRDIAEIGTHLHPWTSPPYMYNKINLNDHLLPTDLEIEIFRQKLALLSKNILNKTGHSPTSYRAGRWGFDKRHISVLVDLGYKVDTSVTPLQSWREISGAKGTEPDFSTAPQLPYFLDSENVCQSGKSKLFEIPVTILYTNSLISKIRHVKSFYQKYSKSLVGKVLNKALKLDYKWFRPFPENNFSDFKKMYNACESQNIDVINIMFHSSELMPGCSPYNKDEESIEELYNKFSMLFNFFEKKGVASKTLTEYYTNYTESKKLQ